MTDLPLKTPLDLWPALYSILHAESREPENYKFGDFNLNSIFAASAVPVHELEDEDERVSLSSVGSWLRTVPPDTANRIVLNLLDEVLRHGKKGRRFAFDADGKRDFFERLETLCKRCGWAVVDGQAIPVTLQLPSEVTTLNDSDRSEIAKAIKRYQSGDCSGAVTSILGMIDLLCQKILINQYDHAEVCAMPYQTKVGNAYKARMPEFVSELVREGVEPRHAEEICKRQQSSVSNAGGVLMSFRARFADVHGSRSAPGAFVQAALDGAVYIVRVLGVRERRPA